MKTRLRIIHSLKIQNFTLIEVELIEGNKILKDDIFINDESKEFIVRSVGIIESKIDNVFPLTVEFNTEIELDELEDTFFEKKTDK